jgi:membrane protease YdiL (CAAX protease family)
MRPLEKIILLFPIFLLALLAPFARLGILNASFLFEPNQVYIFKNLYGFLAFETISLYLLGALILYLLNRKKTEYKTLLESFVKSKIRIKDLLLGFGVGVLITLIAIASSIIIFGDKILFNPFNPIIQELLYPNSLIDILVIAPVVEELVYRGVLINIIILAFYRKKEGTILAIILSSVIFGYTHPAEQVIKVIVGLGLSILYLSQKERNLALPISAHISSNLVRIFFT